MQILGELELWRENFTLSAIQNIHETSSRLMDKNARSALQNDYQEEGIMPKLLA